MMPLLMGCTRPSSIETMDNEGKIIYDPMTQISEMNMRVVGTYSLKTHTTHVGGNGKGFSGLNKVDKKNEIDDQKNVK